MVNKVADRIESLEQRLKALKAQKAKSDSRRRSLDRRHSRRDDLRRKILVGAIILAKIDAGLMDQATLTRFLDDSLEQPEDRALFGLKPRGVTAEKA